jgi:putative transposase
VLMPNHYHLLVETPEANLSRVGQWLNVSYSVWFNRRHRRVGHLFQGRFKAVLIGDDAGFQEVARYIHLNPVRVARLGLDKSTDSARAWGLAPAPSPAEVRLRLKTLREFAWSSYRTYAGYENGPAWLCRSPLGKLCGGRSLKERTRAFRSFVQEAVSGGIEESPWERVVGGLVLGSEELLQRVRAGLKANEREQGRLREFRQPVSWESVIRAVESEWGERWEQFRDRYGDAGRDVAAWVGRRRGRMKLRELAEGLAVDYATAGKAVSRMGRRLGHDTGLRRRVDRIERQLSKDEM